MPWQALWNRTTFGILVVAASLYIACAALTFSPYDPSLVSVVLPATPVQNWAGAQGARLGGLMWAFFGGLATVLFLPLLWFGIHLLKRSPWNVTLKRPLQLLGLITGAGLLLPLLTKEMFIEAIPWPIAGRFGSWLHAFLLTHVGLFGVLLIAATILLLAWPISLKALPALVKKSVKQSLPPQKPSPPEPKPVPTRMFKEDLPTPLTPKPKTQPSYPSPSIASFKSVGEKDIGQKQQRQAEETAERLLEVLKDFGVGGQVTGFLPGPVVTVYEFKPNAGIKLSKLTSLLDDLALALKVDSIFMSPVRGKNVIGIEIPNEIREMVYFGDVIKSPSFQATSEPLAFAIGKDLAGNPVWENLATMPHLLMAGQTGSGKSVAINSLICSLLMKGGPEEVRMILVDPKILELKVYEGIPHLLMPVITDPNRASKALKWATSEMDRRYHWMEFAKVRQISGFNEFWTKAPVATREALKERFPNDEIGILPYIVIVIDELADIMLTAPKDVENSIQRLAQKARACGIHLVLATQRPSVDVITGVIKANLPSRIAFKVFSRGDSRTILDANGADRLLGKGDLLYLKPGARLQRIQGAFLSDEEVVEFIDSIKQSSPSNYDQRAIAAIDTMDDKEEKTPKDYDGDDPKWDEALDLAQSMGQISASYLQRSLKVGYNRAARMVEQMASMGLIGPADGAKPRPWLGTQT